MSDKKLIFEGEVEMHADGNWHMGASVRIGGRDVINDIRDTFGPIRPWNRESPKVRVVLGVESLEGEAWLAEGFRGTDVTPCEPPEFTVGGANVLERLRQLDGRIVALTAETMESGG